MTRLRFIRYLARFFPVPSYAYLYVGTLDDYLDGRN